VERRLGVLVEILDIPAARRPPAMWAAIRREAVRMLDERRHPERLASVDESEVHGMYAAGLVRALGELHDPTAIPTLIDYSGSTRYARDALIEFGDVAVPALIATVRAGRDDVGQVGGAISILGRLLEANGAGATGLADDHRRALVELAEELLGPKFTANGYDWVIARLALATGRADLRAQVEELATSREAWIRRGIDVSSFSLVDAQRSLRILLDKSPKR